MILYIKERVDGQLIDLFIERYFQEDANGVLIEASEYVIERRTNFDAAPAPFLTVSNQGYFPVGVPQGLLLGSGSHDTRNWLRVALSPADLTPSLDDSVNLFFEVEPTNPNWAASGPGPTPIEVVTPAAYYKRKSTPPLILSGNAVGTSFTDATVLRMPKKFTYLRIAVTGGAVDFAVDSQAATGQVASGELVLDTTKFSTLYLWGGNPVQLILYREDL